MPDRSATAALMFVYIAGVMSFYYILKPIRSALFLRDLPASSLPYAYLLTALIAAPLVAVVYKYGGRISLITLITATNAGVIGSLLLFRWAVSMQFSWLPYAYFAYVQIVSALCVSQFWLLAGYVFNERQARRIYGLLGAGGIAGSIAGSLITDFLKTWNTGAMLGICAIICLGLTVVAHLICRLHSPGIIGANEAQRYWQPSERVRDLPRLVFSSRLLRLMVLLVLLTMIASQIADWQVDYAAQESFKHLPKQLMEQEIKSFRARFNGITNCISIVLQLTVTHFVIQRIGIWAAILFLPIGLGISSLGVIFAPGLRSTSISLGTGSVFRYSIHRSGFELFFLPFSAGMRKKVKLFIDVFVDRLGRAIAAFVILAFTSHLLPIGLAGTSAAMLLLTGACLIVSLKMRKSFVDAFRRRLARREVDLSEIHRYVTDPASLRLLATMLESPQERQIVYALGLLQSARGFDYSQQLLPLLRHPSRLVREEAVRTLHALPGDHESEAVQLLGDESGAVRDAAIEYLCLHDSARTAVRIQNLLDHPDCEIRLAAVRCAASLPISIFRPDMELIRGLMAQDGDASCQAQEVAARLASRLPREDAVPFLRILMQNPYPQVSAAAILAAGQSGYAELASDIYPFLSDRKMRTVSRQALIVLGAKNISELAGILSDENEEPAVRREIPWILARIQDSNAARVLVENLYTEDVRLRFQIVKALSRMHARNPILPGNRHLVEMYLNAQIMAYYEDLVLCQGLDTKRKTDSDRLVRRAMRERMEKQLEIVFRLLGILYAQKDIYFAYTALKGKQNEKRISAIEFLDDILKKDVKSLILPLLEEVRPERLLSRAVRLFNLRIPGRKDALKMLLQQRDPWLRACGLYAIGSDGISDLESLCVSTMQDKDPRVREMAEWALGRLHQTSVGIIQ